MSMSVVYFTPIISSESLKSIFSNLNWNPVGHTAVKISTGEPPRSNYLRPELIKELIDTVDGTIVECNTAYDGFRHDTESHIDVIKKHGFNTVADVEILDAYSDIILPVRNGYNLTRNYVGAGIEFYDSMIVLSHFKGHTMAGFGGALKNISIGLASARGKCWIHSSGNSLTTIDGNHIDFLESMVDAASSIIDYYRNNIVYINVLNNLSVDCDCDGHPAEPEMDDIGIAASFDPVALDQACIDLVSYAPNSEALLERINSRDGLHTIECAEEHGLGSREYEFIEIDT